jgi:dynein heavy chain, axonemal
VQKNKSDEDFQDLVFRHLNAITEQLYSKICVGLFETHKLIFAFLICTRIKKHACLIDPQEWSIFYKGADLSQIQSDE